MVFKLWVTPTCSQGEQPPRKRAGRERKWRRGLGVEGTRAVSCPRTHCGHFPWGLSLDLHLRPGRPSCIFGKSLPSAGQLEDRMAAELQTCYSVSLCLSGLTN